MGNFFGTKIGFQQPKLISSIVNGRNYQTHTENQISIRKLAKCRVNSTRKQLNNFNWSSNWQADENQLRSITIRSSPTNTGATKTRNKRRSPIAVHPSTKLVKDQTKLNRQEPTNPSIINTKTAPHNWEERFELPETKAKRTKTHPQAKTQNHQNDHNESFHEHPERNQKLEQPKRRRMHLRRDSAGNRPAGGMQKRRHLCWFGG